jgi:hypothetical protein
VFAVPSGSVVGWLNNSVVSVMVDSDGNDQVDAQAHVTGTLIHKTDTAITLLVTSKVGTATVSSWFVSYRGQRIDHDPATGRCLGTLIEESRTNLFQRSDEFTSSTWLKTGSTVAGDVIISPDGLTTGDLMSEDSSLSIHIIQQLGITSTAGQPYTVSVFARAASHTSFQIAFSVTAFGSTHANFILTGDGSIGTVGGLTARIEKYPNGWYRCSATLASAGGGSGGSVVIVANNNNSSSSRIPSYQGTGAQVVYLWGAQVEAGSFATSYIPTVASSVVRSADVCSITGGNFTSFWNTNEGAIFASGDPRAGANVAALVMANSGVNANQIAFDRISTAIKFGIANSGTYTATISQNSTNGSFVKISGAYATNNARSALNGVLGTPDTSVIVPTNLNRFNIGSAGAANTEFANGCISEIKYFRKPLSNAKLQALTV